jgi:hypothetical protein
VGSWNLKETIGYGYDPGKAIVGISILSPLGWILFRRSCLAGQIVPRDASAYQHFKKDGNLQHGTTLLEFCTAYLLNRSRDLPGRSIILKSFSISAAFRRCALFAQFLMRFLHFMRVFWHVSDV